MAAANCARRALLRSSSSSAKATLLNTSSRSSSSSSSSFASGAAKLGGFSSAKPTTSAARFSGIRNPFSSRLPVELGCAQSLMPLHSVTASALLTSMLSLKAGNWAWLSEGFATPL